MHACHLGDDQANAADDQPNAAGALREKLLDAMTRTGVVLGVKYNF